MKTGLLILGNKEYVDSKSMYETVDDGNKLVLKYASFDKTWTYPGKEAYSLVDTGDNVVITDYHINKKFTLDYSQLEAVRALLKMQDRKEVSTYTLLETTVETK